MHLILNCRSLDSSLTHAFIRHCEDLPIHWRLSLCTKPGRDSAIAYEACQRNLPKCRIIAAWSEQELLSAAACGWREHIACWWDVSSEWPTWLAVNHLWHHMQRVHEATCKACPVGFTGIDASGSEVEHEGCLCVQCHAIKGPVMFAQSQAGLLAGCQQVADMHDAGLALCEAVRLRQKRCCYQVPRLAIHLPNSLR